MTRTHSQRLIALLCLVAFGLGQTLFVSVAVRCRDASGESRIELGCLKSSTGACLASCNDAEATDDAQSDAERPNGPVQPCEDEPLVEPTAVAKALPKHVTYDTAAAAILVAVLVYSFEFAEPDTERGSRAGSGRDHPPDAISRLRTVILLV